MSCECHQIGGRFIAEDPDCPAHGLEAQRESLRRDEVIARLERGIEDSDELYAAALDALAYLRSL